MGWGNMGGTSLILVATALVVGGCNSQTGNVAGVDSPGVPEVVKAIELTPVQVTNLQKGIRDSLKDPESARFGMHKAGLDAKGNLFVCGLVNAKNSYGGYTGMSPYNGMFIKSGQFIVAGLSSGHDMATAILQVCAKQGLAI
jgi:hypothetical protein